MERTLTKQNVLEIFKEELQGVAMWNTLDSIAKREEWSYFTDSLCKAGDISLKQYESWSNPF